MKELERKKICQNGRYGMGREKKGSKKKCSRKSESKQNKLVDEKN
jgi:hypothetical protein